MADRSSILDSSAVWLVVEIVSPGSRTADRLAKPALYAQAGIRWFWRVETEAGPTIHAHRLVEGTYREMAVARPDELLVVDEPFPLTIDPAELQP